MNNDESTSSRNPRRAGRKVPTDVQGPSDRSDLPDVGLPDGQVLEPEWQYTDKPGWRSETSWNCTLCTFYGWEYDDIHNRKEFRAHLDRVHKRQVDVARRADRVIPCVTHCQWFCSVCGAEHWYPTDGDKHGGPYERSFDKRFGFTNCRGKKYPHHKRYLGKIDGASGPVIFYHAGMEFSEQPIQDDESLKEFIDEKSIPKPSTKRGKRTQRDSGNRKAVQRAGPEGGVLGKGRRTVRAGRTPKTA